MGVNYGPRIVTDDLSLFFDASNTRSYPGTGTTLFDMTRNQRNSSLINGVSYTTSVDGIKCLAFDGIGEQDGSPTGGYITLDTAATTTDPLTKLNGVTYEAWFCFTGSQSSGHSLFFGSGTINHLEYKGSLASGYYRTEAVTQNGYSFSGTAGSSGGDGGHSTNEWFQLVLVFANNETNRPVRWYRDGQQFGLGNMTSGNNPTTEYFRPNAFGRATGSASFLYSNSFLGNLTILRMYDRTLTDAEIRRNFIAHRSKFNI